MTPSSWRAGWPAPARRPQLHPVAEDLLELLADHYELGVDNGDRVFRLTKRPRSIDE